MMGQLTQASVEKLRSVDPRLAQVVRDVASVIDIYVVTGHRDKADQDEAYQTGASDLQWPHSKHNKLPSLAVDLAPKPLDWDDRDRFILLAGAMLGAAAAHGLTLRWGGAWHGWENGYEDGVLDTDLGHFEIMNPTIETQDI